MNGQADKLRERMAGAGGVSAVALEDSRENPARTPLAHTVAIGSGKGGVGKSTAALSIAWSAAERGVKTALIDADLGLANLDILCGVQPVRTAADWLAGRAVLADCFMRLAPRLWLLPGASGVARLADLQQQQRVRLVEGLARVAAHVDLVVVDLGAGLGPGTLDIAAAADRLLVLCTAEPTSVADAYGFVKACVKRGRTEQYQLAMNMVTDAAQAQHQVARLCNTAARFLSVRVECVGGIPMDAAVRSAVLNRQPLMVRAPHSSAARAMRQLEGHLSQIARPRTQAGAARVAARRTPAEEGGFFQRLARSMGLSFDSGTIRVEGRIPAGFPRSASAQ